MELRYANAHDVMKELSIDPDDLAQEAEVALIERMELALASAFDSKVGRSFGEVGVPSTRSVRVGLGASVAVLQKPAREIVGIAHGGSWDGNIWAGEVMEDAWHDVFESDGLIYGVERTSGSWPRSIRVTANWASDSTEAVPDDVSHVLTWLTIRQYRRVTASPSELVGPEGFTVPTPHAWDDPMVQEVIKKYRVVEVLV